MRGELLATAELTRPLRDEMYRLMRGQFEGVSRPGFERDLAEKGWVILIHPDEPGSLRGFSTLDVYRRSVAGEEIGVVYSGDTVVDGGKGMGSTLSKIWIGGVNAVRREMGLGRTIWLLPTSGYRTYRFLPMYWLDFHPRFDATGGGALAALRDTLATERFGDLYERETGIVRFPEPQVLRPDLRGIPTHRLADEHVRFFAEANPGHEAGDELVSVTELSEANLTPAGRRMWAAGLRLFPVRGAAV